MSQFDRFQRPRYFDEKATCLGCRNRFHFTQLNDEGLCYMCRDLEEPETQQSNPAPDSGVPPHAMQSPQTGAGYNL